MMSQSAAAQVAASTGISSSSSSSPPSDTNTPRSPSALNAFERVYASVTSPLELISSAVQGLGLWWIAHTYGARVYTWLWAMFGGSDAAVAFVLIAIVPFITFICVGIAFGYLDFTASESFLRKYKLQRKFRPDFDDYIGAAWIALRNFFFITFPYAVLVAWVFNPLRGSKLGPTPPTLMEFLRDLSISIIAEEFLFYYSHRALHHPKIYAYVHKFHHSYTAPFAIAAVYAHEYFMYRENIFACHSAGMLVCSPFEHFLSNIFPLTAGPLLMGSHPFVACIWSTLAVINTMSSHSGYALPGMPPPQFHDWHHEKFNENFGVMGWLDLLHGTSTRFAAQQLVAAKLGSDKDHDSDSEVTPDADSQPSAANRKSRDSSSPSEDVPMPTYAKERYGSWDGPARDKPKVVARRRDATASK